MKIDETKLSEVVVQNVKEWMATNKDEETFSQLSQLIKTGDWKEIEDSFYKDLSIGTGGIRGKIGPGTNRINSYTIGRAAQGLSDFIASFGGDALKKGVVVGYDVCHFSKEFAEMCAE